MHPWHLRGRTIQLTCGTVQLFFDFLLHLIYFCYKYKSIFGGGSLFFPDDAQIRTTEDQAYKRTVYILIRDRNITLIYIFLQIVLSISEVGRSSLLAERPSFSLISCSTWSIFVTKYIDFCMGITFFSDDTQIRTMGITFFSDDTQIRTTEDQA